MGQPLAVGVGIYMGGQQRILSEAMNTLKTFSSVLAAAGLLSFCSAGSAVAFGGGAGGGTGAGAGGAGASAGGGGGGHGGGISGGSSGSGHAGAAGGFHSGLSGQSSFRSMAASYNGAPHYLPGGFSPNGSGRVGSAGRAARRSGTSRAVTATQGADNLVSARSNPVAAARPGNAWTDPVSSNGVRTADRQVTADLSNRSDISYRQYIANGNYNGLTTPGGIAGTYLYPGAYGSALNSYFNGQAQRGALGYNGPARNFAQARSAEDPYAGNYRYRPNGYYPYFGVYGFPFFGSDFGYGYYGDGYGDGNLSSNNVGNNDQSVATMDSGPAPADQPAAQAGPDAQNPPNAAPVQPASPNAKAASGVTSNGPDSLIEAVQAELARRGYFTGTVNAMYGPATREALRRFQTDAGLAATGRINEATMHALQLD